MTSGAPIMSSQKIGPNSLASRARFCTGAVESSDSMLPTTGLVGGCGVGLSRLVDAIAIVPAFSLQRRHCEEFLRRSNPFSLRADAGLLGFACNDDSGLWFTQTAFYAIRSAWR